MIDTAPADLSACRHWRRSAALGGARVGIIPAWNAVTLLNPAAATIWDLLIETRDAGAAAAAYARHVPARAQAAQADVQACLDVWQKQGLFHPPAPSDEERLLKTLEGLPPPRGEPVSFRRTFFVAGVPTTLEIEDPTLGQVVADLLVDFTDTDSPPQTVLRSSGPQGGWVLSIDGRPARVATNLPLARGQIVAELVRIAGGDAGWRATVHGAVLSGPSGPVLLAGESGAGKSTLSAGLVALGWQILAEDLAAFGDEWTVCPLPFALSIKDGAVATLAPAFPDLTTARAHQLGPRRVRYQGLPARARTERPQRPRMVLDVGYTADMGTGPAEFHRLTELETLGLFMNDESYVGFERDDTSDFLDFVAEIPAYKIRYGTIAAAERGIRERLDRHRREDRW